MNNVIYNNPYGLSPTVDKETGYITVNGTPASNYKSIVTAIDITDKLQIGKTYTLWQEKYGTLNNSGLYLQVNAIDTENNIIYYNSMIKASSFVAKEGYTYQVVIQTSTIENTGTLTNYKNRYMIYERNRRQAF